MSSLLARHAECAFWLARYLERSGIAFVSLDGADFYPSKKVGGHWTPAGQVFVAERVFKLLTENNIVP